MKRTTHFQFVLPLFFLGCLVVATPSSHATDFWQILDTKQIGADSFVRSHPRWDGRKAVIAVLDTGVDMGIAGLTAIPSGQPKVIEARDFSGQGEVALTDASKEVIEGKTYWTIEAGKVRGLKALPTQPVDGVWRLGFLNESRFKNSAVKDINHNGNRSDKFAIVTAKLKDGSYIAYVDKDGNHDFTGETPLKNFNVAQQSFTFTRTDPSAKRSPVTYTLHIEDEGLTVSVHFDDGGHGTHVAGIAAGYNLMGRKGFNGIAPGAQIISLKIGDNTLSGGSTTSDSMRRAIEFAGEWTETHKRAVIMNISYGIGSEIEGESDIDVVLDKVLSQYPLLAASVSAGNEGPGLSSVGTPAAARWAMAAAAMHPQASASALFGSRIDRDQVFSFSSRGGELAKPDVLLPGIASASVPNFDRRDIKGGTSMAAPQLSGLHALLVSAALDTKTKFTGSTLRRAILDSAKPLSGYPLVAQGAGVPNAKRAWKALRTLAKHDEPFKVVGYAVSTDVPTSVSSRGHAAYWRTGTYLPSKTDGHIFDIQAQFRPEEAAETKDGFQTLLRLRSTASWLRVDRSTARLIGDRATKVRVSYDATALRKPGVYSAAINATPDDGGGITATALWNTVVVPYTFGPDNNYARLFQKQTLKPGNIRRVPILVPPGATHLRVEVRTPRGSWGKTRLKITDPAGHEVDLDHWRASSEQGTTAHANIHGRALTPGIWEVLLYGSFRNRKTTTYDLDIAFRGVDSRPIRSFESEPGKPPHGSFQVTNRYNTRFNGQARGSVVGFQKTHTLEAEGDGASIPFHLSGELSGVDFVLRLSPRTYNRFTDVALQVLDANGKAVAKSGFSNGLATIHLENNNGSASASYTLDIRGGFTDDDGSPWTVEVQETFRRRDAIPVSVNDGAAITLYPQVRAHLDFSLQATPPRPPEGYVNVGQITFTNAATKDAWLTIPIELK